MGRQERMEHFRSLHVLPPYSSQFWWFIHPCSHPPHPSSPSSDPSHSLPPSLLLFIYTSKVNTELYNVQVLSLVLLQLLELSLTLFLLRSTAKPQFKSFNFLKGTNNSVGRNWVVGSALGFGTLVAFIFLTSLVAHQLFPSQVSLSLSLSPESLVSF